MERSVGCLGVWGREATKPARDCAADEGFAGRKRVARDGRGSFVAKRVFGDKSLSGPACAGSCGGNALAPRDLGASESAQTFCRVAPSLAIGVAARTWGAGPRHAGAFAAKVGLSKRANVNICILTRPAAQNKRKNVGDARSATAGSQVFGGARNGRSCRRRPGEEFGRRPFSPAFAASRPRWFRGVQDLGARRRVIGGPITHPTNFKR